MQEAANKQKRMTLKTLHEMLNGMSVELAEKVHLLFMANYIDYSDYNFRDENLVESYCWCYRDFFELKTKESLEIVNSQLIEFLDEWRQDAPSRYRKAKDDICYWITDEWYSFESPMQKEIESAFQTALKKNDDMAIALALSPFAEKTAELVCDAQAQYGDYSELVECPMWGIWLKEGGNEIKALRKTVGNGGERNNAIESLSKRRKIAARGSGGDIEGESE